MNRPRPVLILPFSPSAGPMVFFLPVCEIDSLIVPATVYTLERSFYLITLKRLMSKHCVP